MLTCTNRAPVHRLDTRRSRPVLASAQPNVDRNTAQLKQITLKVTPLTPENIKPFGQIISTSDDGKLFDQEDAQLVLNQGTPRFYIMRLPARGLRFHRITYHGKVTQCLGGLTPPHPWYMALATPTGSLERYPRSEDIRVFRIPFGSFIKMEVGTWHAGPLFAEPGAMDFYNLELSDTNVIDHNTHDYRRDNNTEFIVVDDLMPDT
ncbi:hypothetical protein Vretimale_18366 [Volvox reticuliferus]|uniref:Ureidoglycolate hydrolase n=1 Tax=Volvox reticuliferus TaxID=1737510 RepID=A0A8J4GWR9_9CHLO|nr:hypothetical protein Vretifemale_8810 [Volvox reticuliferus]GIM15600.1 hypothetical protein Vretimale_18366 [Volvox reticuliferus]